MSSSLRDVSRILAIAATMGISLARSLPASENQPELPRISIDSDYVEPAGRIVKVAAGADLQAALDAARPGEVIELAAGATFRGNFNVHKKQGDDWIIVRSGSKNLPAPGNRVSPSDAPQMAKIVTANTSPVLHFDPGAHHYRWIGLEITTTWASTSGTLPNLVLLGLTATGEAVLAAADLPSDIIFDRCYIHGTPNGNVRRGIALNSGRTSVIDSHLSDFHEVGAEAQALGGWNGTGPFKIVNNYVEAAGENLLLGGSETGIPDLVTSDIEIRRNHFFKPLRWKKGDPQYAGTEWTVKNSFELKNAQRVLIDSNVFENSWAQAQTGPAIVLSPQKQYCKVPWAVVNDITFTHNVVRHAAEGMRITALAADCPKAGPALARVLIQDNLFEDIGGPKWGMSDGFVFMVISHTMDVIIEHNTALGQGAVLISDGEPNERFVFRDNIAPHNAYGVFGSGKSVGNGSLKFYFPQATFTKNVLIGPWPTRGGGRPAMYSEFSGNYFPGSIDDVRFVDAALGDYRLADSSRWKRAASDGRDIGVDFDRLRDAVAAVKPRAATGNPAAEERTGRE